MNHVPYSNRRSARSSAAQGRHPAHRGFLPELPRRTRRVRDRRRFDRPSLTSACRADRCPRDGAPRKAQGPRHVPLVDDAVLGARPRHAGKGPDRRDGCVPHRLRIHGARRAQYGSAERRACQQTRPAVAARLRLRVHLGRLRGRYPRFGSVPGSELHSFGRRSGRHESDSRSHVLEPGMDFARPRHGASRDRVVPAHVGHPPDAPPAIVRRRRFGGQPGLVPAATEGKPGSRSLIADTLSTQTRAPQARVFLT